MKNKFWTDLEKKWYIPLIGHKYYYRKKIVPLDLVLTPLTLCIWFMDDGSNDKKRGNIILNTQGFNPKEIDYLIYRLKTDLDINGVPQKSKNKLRIYINVNSYHKFLETIKPYINWNCFAYKIDTSFVRKKTCGEHHKLSKLKEKDVNYIFELKINGEKNKDIAKKIGISASMVSNILRGKKWKHIGKTLIKNKGFKKSGVLEKQYILSLYNQGKTHKEIGKIVGKCQSTITRIINKESKCQELI